MDSTLLLVLRTGTREDAVIAEPGTPIEFNWPYYELGMTMPAGSRWPAPIVKFTPLGATEPIELLAESLVSISLGGGSAALDARRLGITVQTNVGLD